MSSTNGFSIMSLQLPPFVSQQVSRMKNLPVVERYKDHLPRKLAPTHYASIAVLIVIVMVNIPTRGSSNLLRSQHCLDLELAVEATTSSMRHASSRDYPKGFCERIPRHQSAAWLWNAQSRQILEATYDSLQDGVATSLTDAFRVLQPMAMSVRGRPQHDIWGHFINKIELKLTEDDLLSESGPIKVLVVGGHYDAATSCSMLGQSTTYLDGDCSWPKRLQEVVYHYFGEDILQINFLSLEHAKTSLMTHAIRMNQVSVQDADLIIYAMTSQELYNDFLLVEMGLERPIDTESHMAYYQRLMFRVQDFVRASLDSQPCEDYPPPVLLLDDYVGNLHDKVMIEYSMTRALQQVADHYRIGYISYPHLVRKLIMADTSESIWTPDWSRGTSIQHGRLGHIAILWSLLYNMLEYTVDFCSHESDINEYRLVQKKAKLVEDWVFDRIQQQPPYLSGDLLWANISPRWKEAGENSAAHKNLVCDGHETQAKGRQCSIAHWGGGSDGTKMTAAESQIQLKPYIQRSSGFKILEGGILRATQPKAYIEFLVKEDGLDADQLALFFGPGDFEILKDPMNQLDNAEVKFTVSAGGVNATLSRTINVVDRMSWVQEVPEGEPGQGIRLSIELIVGATVDIVGVFLCTSDEITFYNSGAWSGR